MISKMDEQVYRYWWLHDGAWYQNVAGRFGFEVANELNKECLRYMARRTMRSYVKENRVNTSYATIEELVKHLMEGTLVMWPEGWCETEVHILGTDTFDVVLTKNFALDMLRRAGTLEHYACPCLTLREGWFAGLGVKHHDEELECMLKGDDVCHLRARIELPTRDASEHE